MASASVLEKVPAHGSLTRPNMVAVGTIVAADDLASAYTEITRSAMKPSTTGATIIHADRSDRDLAAVFGRTS